MFLRDRVPSEGERKVARGIRTGHFVGMVITAVCINIATAGHLIRSGPSSGWIWIQVSGVALLLLAIGALIWVIKKPADRRPDSE